MFEIGFWELVVIGVIGIVVIGPERLPEVARSLLLIIRKIRRTFSDVRADIERELDLDDMRKMLRDADMDAHIKKLNDNIMSLDKQAREIGNHIKEDLEQTYDGYTPEDAEAEAETGVELPLTDKEASTIQSPAPDTVKTSTAHQPQLPDTTDHSPPKT
ncbi:MAG: Sec-independent protein translocase protein TatB [Cardiobacteriaceae bacterium]|nr:Sec-independent protein translocase protein TatB [Cardiobacteriaceae bacterium]